MITRWRALSIIKKYQESLSEEYGVPFSLVDITSDFQKLQSGDAETVTNARMEVQEVYIGISDLYKKFIFADETAFCNTLIALGHEAEHVEQLNDIREHEASDEFVYSWVADTVSERYYDLNYDLSYREIAAERKGVEFALGVLEYEFDKEYAYELMSKRMESVRRVRVDEQGSKSTTDYMLAQVDENFAQSENWDALFKELLEKSKTAERSYSPYIYENHYVDDLERFYTKSEENKEFIDRAVKQGNADKFICAAGICENTGHYSRNADWLPEGRSMLVNMKTDMLGYLQRESNAVDDKRLSVDMSTLDSDDETMSAGGYGYV